MAKDQLAFPYHCLPDWDHVVCSIPSFLDNKTLIQVAGELPSSFVRGSLCEVIRFRWGPPNCPFLLLPMDVDRPEEDDVCLSNLPEELLIYLFLNFLTPR